MSRMNMIENSGKTELPDADRLVYSIGTVARMLGVSVFTLRMYEREGLILAHKSESKQRRYSKNDIERLKCIRRAITEQKFGIAGIQTIYSLIPCWSITRCSEQDRAHCDSFRNHTRPCWTYRHINNTCEARNCRECPVYRNASNCDSVKESIIEASGATA
jgi:MerR family transcriptional regulator/heat shock protein HspR